ncbi:MAG: hypothetical protein K2Y71_21430 [Xanthobacteraceae bacterium]|nr:hypothetical protein [Xanthobacteraceae bacterium]
MINRLILIVGALALVGAANASAQPKAKKAPTEKKAPSNPKVPLHLYLAKGEPNACGEGCSEWIAVEGSFDPDAGGRAQAFLKRHAARKLPVYLHSPGGNTTAALTLGRYLRQQGITAGVAATVPRGCESAFDQSKACNAAKRSSQPVLADWRPDVACSSACVWALLGAKVRHVPPGARLGVHAGKLTLMRKLSDGRVQTVSPGQYASLHKERSSAMESTTRRYIREMGIDTRLLDAAQKIAHEDIYYLSRDQIAAFGIDRREFAETPWFFAQFSNGSAYVSKWIVEARGPERKEYRVSVVIVRCSTTTARAGVQFVRGLARDEIERPATAIFSIGQQKLRLPLMGASQRDAIDTGGMFSAGSSSVLLAELEAAAASDAAIRVTGGDPRLDTKLFNVFELSTHGLAASLKPLRERCGQPAQPASWTDSTKAPAAPMQKGGPAIPASPYGAYPAPELGLKADGAKKK